MTLYGVYHANGGRLGKLAYGVGKIMGGTRCALCEVTYGRVREKRNDKARTKELPLTTIHLHLNEQPDSLKQFTKGKTPCVVIRKEGSYMMLRDKNMLAGYQGEVSHFYKALQSSLETFL